MWGKGIGPTADQPEASVYYPGGQPGPRVDALLLTGGHALTFNKIVAGCSFL